MCVHTHIYAHRVGEGLKNLYQAIYNENTVNLHLALFPHIFLGGRGHSLPVFFFKKIFFITKYFLK